MSRPDAVDSGMSSAAPIRTSTRKAARQSLASCTHRSSGRTATASARWLPTEGTGDAQTPLRDPGTAHLRVGGQVRFRHAQEGGAGEHVDELHGITGDPVTDDVLSTYRGEGRPFG